MKHDFDFSIGAALRDRAAREADLAKDKSTRQAQLNREIEHALDDAARARDQALKLIDNPSRWDRFISRLRLAVIGTLQRRSDRRRLRYAL